MKYFIGILFCFFSLLAEAQSTVNYQIDRYFAFDPISKITHQGFHKVIKITLKVPQSESLNKPLVFNVEDYNSDYKMKIFYDQGVWTYPNLFSKKNHFEYSFPTCDKKMCQFIFFIYNTNSLQKLISLNIEISQNNKTFYQTKIKSNNLFKGMDNLNIENLNFLPLLTELFPHQMRFKLESQSLEMLKPLGLKPVQATAVTKNFSSPTVYNEINLSLLTSNEVVFENPDFLYVPYLAIMVFYENENLTFEDKYVFRKNFMSDYD